MLRILFIPLFFFSVLPVAAVDFSGRWSGTGQVTTVSPFVGNKTYPCSKIEIHIEHRPEQVTVGKYNAVCEFVGGSDWGPYNFEIRGEKVFEDGEETGTLIGDTMKTLQASGGVQYAFNLRLKEVVSGQEPILESYYGTRNMMGTIVIEGNLTSSK